MNALTSLAFLMLFLSPGSPSGNPSYLRGMNYYIYPDRPTCCKDDFADGLSFFFEQVGGYGGKAEVEQVSHILHIDLSIFQDVQYNPEDPTETAKHWHDIDSFAAVVDTFMVRIQAYPGYYRKVVYNPNKQQQDEAYNRIMQMPDKKAALRLTEDMEKQPFYDYPGDHGYLSKGRLLADLRQLRQTLACYKENKVRKIRLEYM